MDHQVMNEGEQAITAITNIVAALSATMLASGQKAALSSFLGMFDAMNDGSLPAGSALDKLKTATKIQRNIMAQMP